MLDLYLDYAGSTKPLRNPQEVCSGFCLFTKLRPEIGSMLAQRLSNTHKMACKGRPFYDIRQIYYRCVCLVVGYATFRSLDNCDFIQRVDSKRSSHYRQLDTSTSRRINEINIGMYLAQPNETFAKDNVPIAQGFRPQLDK